MSNAVTHRLLVQASAIELGSAPLNKATTNVPEPASEIQCRRAPAPDAAHRRWICYRINTLLALKKGLELWGKGIARMQVILSLLWEALKMHG